MGQDSSLIELFDYCKAVMCDVTVGFYPLADRWCISASVDGGKVISHLNRDLETAISHTLTDLHKYYGDLL